MFRDWNAIKAEYVTTGCTYRALAEKYGVPPSTLINRGGREDWKGARMEYAGELERRTLERTVRENAQDTADKLLKLQAAADSMTRLIDETAKGISALHRDEPSRADTRSIKELAGALKDLAAVVRSVYDLPTAQERSAMETAAEKLRLEKERTRQDSEAEDSFFQIAFEGGAAAWGE